MLSPCKCIVFTYINYQFHTCLSLLTKSRKMIKWTCRVISRLITPSGKSFSHMVITSFVENGGFWNLTNLKSLITIVCFISVFLRNKWIFFKKYPNKVSIYFFVVRNDIKFKTINLYKVKSPKKLESLFIELNNLVYFC